MTAHSNETYPAGMHRTLGNTLQALKHCARSLYRFPDESEGYSACRNAEMNRADIQRGDEAAAQFGPFARQVAAVAGLTEQQARRYLLQLEEKALAMRPYPNLRGGAHRWWPVGFAEELVATVHQEPRK